MFNISKLVNKIAERASQEAEGSSSSISVVHNEEEQHSEGFLCPSCMVAFPSSETLQEHYNSAHADIQTSFIPPQQPPPPSSNGNESGDRDGDSHSSGENTNVEVRALRHEINNLEYSLAQERLYTMQLKEQILDLQQDTAHQRDSIDLFNAQAAAFSQEMTEQQTAIMKERDSLLAQNEEMNGQIVMLKVMIDGLHEKVAEHEATRHELVDVAANKEGHIDIFMSKIRVLEAANESLERQKLENEKKFEEELEKIRQERRETLERLTNVESNYEEAVSKSKEEAGETVARLKKVISDLEEALLKSKANEENAQKRFDEQLDKLRQEARETLERLNIVESGYKKAVSKSNEATETVERLRKINSDFEEALSKSKANEEKAKKKFEEELGKLRQEAKESLERLKKVETDYQEAVSKSKKAEETVERLKKLNSDLEEALSKSKTNLENAQKKFEAELEKLRQETRETLGRLTKVESDYQEAVSKSKEAEETVERLKKVNSDFEEAVSKSKENEEKAQLLQIQTDTLLTEKIELEKKLRTTEEEKALVLERCLSGESEMKELQQKLISSQRKQDDSVAALQELGRENQTLQMEIAKLQGRKWADDSVATNCSGCTKEFTLTIRKHHCRHCGQIFCSECSSRTAAVPSCKKPARVCDTCFDELLRN